MNQDGEHQARKTALWTLALTAIGMGGVAITPGDEEPAPLTGGADQVQASGSKGGEPSGIGSVASVCADRPAYAQVPATAGLAPAPAPAQIPEGAWPSIQEQIREAQYFFTPSTTLSGGRSGYRAPNPAHCLDISISSHGLGLLPERAAPDAAPEWELRMAVVGSDPRAALSAECDRVEILHPALGITEWYRNEPDGLEQGYTIPCPQGAEGEVRVSLDIDTTLDPAPGAIANDALVLVDADGAEQLRYDKLMVYDATGRELPAHMEMDERGDDGALRLHLIADARGATFPVTIDPLFTSYNYFMFATDGVANDIFGASVAVTQTHAAIGAPSHGSMAGAVYLFRRDPDDDSYSLVDKFQAADSVPGRRFGVALSLSLDRLLVGAPEDPPGFAPIGPGAAYRFEPDAGGTWVQRQKLTPIGGLNGDAFGFSITGERDVIVVGAPRDDVGLNDNQGSAYVFTRAAGSDGPFTQLKIVTGTDDGTQALFGLSMKLVGNLLAVGAPGTAGGEGRLYTYGRNFPIANNWGQIGFLSASPAVAGEAYGTAVDMFQESDTVSIVIGVPGRDGSRGAVERWRVPVPDCSPCAPTVRLTPLELDDGQANDLFGFSVAITGDFIAVGVPGADIGALNNFGMVVLHSNQGREVERFYGLGIGNQYGFSLAMDGGIVLAGSPYDDFSGANDRGSALATRIDGGTWAQSRPLLRGDPVEADDEFGVSIAIDQDIMVVGAPGARTSGFAAGAAYVFRRSGAGENTWSWLERLNALPITAGDRFGAAVDIDGDIIVVGAPGRDSGGLEDNGAAYVFRRNLFGALADSWLAERMLIPSAPDSMATFGSSVSVCRDVICVGAPLEDSPQVDRGAAYVFLRNTGAGADNWGEVARLVGSAGNAGDHFAESLDCHNGTVLVGAPGHDPGSVSNRGVVYAFNRSVPDYNGWGEVDRLFIGDAIPERRYGRAVAFDGETLAVGGQYQVNIRRRNAGGTDNIGHVATIRGGIDFGSKIVMCGEKIAVLGDDGNGFSGIQIFRRNVGGDENWGLAAKFASHTGEPLLGGLGFDGEFVASQVSLSAPPSTRVAVFHHQNRAFSIPFYPITAGLDSRDDAHFGISLDMNDDFLIAGAERESSFRGAAYVFGRNVGGADGWGRLAKLTDPAGFDGDRFGFDVAIDFNRAIVGAPYANGAGLERGSAVVFERNQLGADNWGYLTTVTASDASNSDLFGISVDIEGHTAIVGAAAGGTPSTGQAYVFDRTPTAVLAERKILIGTGIVAGDQFGGSVALSGDTAIVGSPLRDAGAGSAFIFERNRTGAEQWGEVRELIIPVAAGAWAGLSVAIDGGLAAVGAPFAEGAAPGTGAVFVFERNAGAVADNWGVIQTVHSGKLNPQGYGSAVGLRGSRLVVGAPHDGKGEVYLYERHLHGFNKWGLMDRLVGPDYPAPGSATGYLVRERASFGTSVAVSDSFFAVGAFASDTGFAAGGGYSSTWDRAGAVYVYHSLSHFRNWLIEEGAFLTDLASLPSIVSAFDSYALLDIDRDGIPLILEYLMGLSPESPESMADAMRVSLEPGGLVLRFRRAKYAPDGRLVVKWSRDLRAWAGDGQPHPTEGFARAIPEEIIADLGDSVVVEARLPLLFGEREAFLRLEAERVTAF